MRVGAVVVAVFAIAAMMAVLDDDGGLHSIRCNDNVDGRRQRIHSFSEGPRGEAVCLSAH